ncbi:MAG: maleylacetoacetate isomerase [Paracoccaceae bacterium]|nr:maleylacetoacetate isomerase [Paracoccaceae bacterium]
MKLYSYWRSSTSYRVRIALNLKGLSYETIALDLATGDQHTQSNLQRNPIGGVPSLVLEDGSVLTQSMAILEYLEAVCPAPSMIPSNPLMAANIRASANVIASDIHPVNNLRVVSTIKSMGHTQDEVVSWMNRWMLRGLQAFQALLPAGTKFSFGDAPTLADVCLIPQLNNAHRWGTDLSSLKRLTEIETRCLAHPAFDAAHPRRQTDAI